MRNPFVIILAFALFMVLWYGNFPLRPFGERLEGAPQSLLYTMNYLLAGVVPLAAWFLVRGTRHAHPMRGIFHGFVQGFIFSLTATLPMFVGFAALYPMQHTSTPDQLLLWIVVAGFFEELFFRGFAFGMLFQYAGWGFVPAVLLSAFPFGALHLYQGHDLVSSLAVFSITALGGALFCWIYAEWNFNLWCVAGLHILMNAAWILFPGDDNGAVGNLTGNLLRLITVAASIMLTVYNKRRSGRPYAVTPSSLFTVKLP